MSNRNPPPLAGGPGAAGTGEAGMNNMRRLLDTGADFDPEKPVVAFRCAATKDCGVRFLKQPQEGAASPPSPIWCSTCGDLLMDANPAVQTEMKL
jgi:hypothetical protein